jgi:hypothetical protein
MFYERRTRLRVKANSKKKRARNEEAEQPIADDDIVEVPSPSVAPI